MLLLRAVGAVTIFIIVAVVASSTTCALAADIIEFASEATRCTTGLLSCRTSREDRATPPTA